VIAYSDAPYQFFEAKPSTPIIRLARFANKHFILPGPNHRIREIALSGETEAVRDAWSQNKRLVFVSNHPTHSDPQILTEVHRRLGIDSGFMAAYDVFLRSRFHAFFMQRLGNFSIDREGSDRKAMSAAMQIIKDGQRALNIFPEGNVFLTNDRLMPFLDGTAFITLKAQTALDDATVTIVPVSMKFTHLSIPKPTLKQRLIDLANHSGHSFPENSENDPVSAVLNLGQHIIGNYLQKHGHTNIAKDSLYDTLATFACGLVESLENDLAIKPSTQNKLTERIGKVRSRLHQLRTDTTSPRDPALDGLADRALLALRIHGYTSPYLTARPTIDRYDETVERIAEDYHSRLMPRTGPRRAMVMLHPPVSVRDFLASQTIQAGIDSLNEKNDTPGATLIDE
jgi:1-acyl-sn-glycerol-3-phosphate acyltransferase